MSPGQAELDAMLARIPYARFLGVRMELHGDEMTAVQRQPRPVDVNIDYLRSGRPEDTYARALIKKAGRRIANVQVEAWQETRRAPIAALHGHFLLTPREAPLP